LEAAEFEKAVATPPFLAKKRMVIIENLISKNKGQKIQKEILEMLGKNGLKETIIVFWESGAGDKPAKKSRSKPGHASARFHRNSLATHSQFTMANNLFRYLSLKIWSAINSVNFHQPGISVDTLLKNKKWKQ